MRDIKAQGSQIKVEAITKVPLASMRKIFINEPLLLRCNGVSRSDVKENNLCMQQN